MDNGGTVSRGRAGGLLARLSAWRRDASDGAIAKRMAGATFLLRVVNAGIALVSQVLMARLMGDYEYGIYAYAWVWVLLLGYAVAFGIPSAAQRLIPEYTQQERFDDLRGFLRHGRVVAVVSASLCAIVGGVGILLAGDVIHEWNRLPLLLALGCLPLFVLTEMQDNIARCYNRTFLASGPAYLIRPLLILAAIASLAVLGFTPSGVSVMVISLIVVCITAVGQALALNRELHGHVPSGLRRSDIRYWLSVSLPIFMIEGFYLLLTYADVILLDLFRPPDDVAVYYAATKIMAIGAFVSFAVANSTAYRFVEYSVGGDSERLATFVQQTVRWTFWPTLLIVIGLVALGKPLLWLFGHDFMSGYMLLPILGVGLLARAAVGPVERLLAMCGQQNRAALIYAFAFVLNVVLGLGLIPVYGLEGAAVATSAALTVESVMLYVAARRGLGIDLFGFPVSP